MRVPENRPRLPDVARPNGPGSAAALPRDVRDVNGLQIDVSGSSGSFSAPQDVERGRGVKALPPGPTPELLSPETTGNLFRLLEGQEPDAAALSAARSASVEGTSLEGLGIAGSVNVTYTPVGAVRSAPGLGYGPDDLAQTEPDKMVLRAQIEDAGRLAAAEAALRREFGPEVKLAEVTETGELTMVRPGHPNYDSIRSADQVSQGLRGDLWKMDLNPREFADSFAKYNSG